MGGVTCKVVSRILILCLLSFCVLCKPQVLPAQANAPRAYTEEQQDSSFHEHRCKHFPINWHTFYPEREHIPEHEIHLLQIRATEVYTNYADRQEGIRSITMVDYMIKEKYIKKQDIPYICNRWALKRLRVVERDTAHVLIEDTLTTGQKVRLEAVFQPFDSAKHTFKKDRDGFYEKMDGRPVYGITYRD